MARGDAGPENDVDILVDLQQCRSALALGVILMNIQELLEKEGKVVISATLHPKSRESILAQAIDM